MKVRDKINKIAKAFLNTLGYGFEEHFDFQTSTDPRMQLCWNAAINVWVALYGDTPDLEAELDEE